MKNNESLKQMDEIAKINDHKTLFQLLKDPDENDLMKLGFYEKMPILRRNADG